MSFSHELKWSQWGWFNVPVFPILPPPFSCSFPNKTKEKSGFSKVRMWWGGTSSEMERKREKGVKADNNGDDHRIQERLLAQTNIRPLFPIWFLFASLEYHHLGIFYYYFCCFQNFFMTFRLIFSTQYSYLRKIPHPILLLFLHKNRCMVGAQ